LLWAAWLFALLVVLPTAGYVAYHALENLDSVPFFSEHRLIVGVAAAAVLIGDLWFLRYVLVDAKRLQDERESATTDLPGQAEDFTVCRKCGPFPNSELVVIQSSRRKTWTMRAFAIVLLGAVGAFMALLVTDHIHLAVGSAPIVLCTIVGMNLWRFSRESVKKCPRCGSKKVLPGTDPAGRHLFQTWQLKQQGG
jgi:hypothetical protein